MSYFWYIYIYIYLIYIYIYLIYIYKFNIYIYLIYIYIIYIYNIYTYTCNYSSYIIYIRYIYNIWTIVILQRYIYIYIHTYIKHFWEYLEILKSLIINIDSESWKLLYASSTLRSILLFSQTSKLQIFCTLALKNYIALK